MKKTKFNIILSVVSIMLGGIIYLITRPEAYVSIFFEGIINLSYLRGLFSILHKDIIKYYLPDFLWSFSFTCALFTVNENRKQVFVTGAVTGIVWECLQYFKIISGTGDIIDIIMYIIAVFIAVLINKKGVFNNEKEQN